MVGLLRVGIHWSYEVQLGRTRSRCGLCWIFNENHIIKFCLNSIKTSLGFISQNKRAQCQDRTLMVSLKDSSDSQIAIVPYSWGRVPCTLHLAPCTLHLAPCTLHLAPCTLQHQEVGMYHSIWSVYSGNQIMTLVKLGFPMQLNLIAHNCKPLLASEISSVLFRSNCSQ